MKHTFNKVKCKNSATCFWLCVYFVIFLQTGQAIDCELTIIILYIPVLGLFLMYSYNT